jgi:hypothetical protein
LVNNHGPEKRRESPRRPQKPGRTQPADHGRASNGGPILDGRAGYITIHPSFLLRMPEEHRADAYKSFVADMKRIRRPVNDQKTAA